MVTGGKKICSILNRVEGLKTKTMKEPFCEKASPKTLKQIFVQKWKKDYPDFPMPCFIFEIDCVREWLQQKAPLTALECRSGFCILQELLEELRE